MSGQVCQHWGARSLQVHTLWGQGPVDINAVFWGGGWVFVKAIFSSLDFSSMSTHSVSNNIPGCVGRGEAASEQKTWSLPLGSMHVNNP